MDERRLLRELNSHVQRVLTEYLPMNSSKSEKDAIAERLGISTVASCTGFRCSLRADPRYSPPNHSPEWTAAAER